MKRPYQRISEERKVQICEDYLAGHKWCDIAKNNNIDITLAIDYVKKYKLKRTLYCVRCGMALKKRKTMYCKFCARLAMNEKMVIRQKEEYTIIPTFGLNKNTTKGVHREIYTDGMTKEMAQYLPEITAEAIEHVFQKEYHNENKNRKQKN